MWQKILSQKIFTKIFVTVTVGPYQENISDLQFKQKI